MSRFIKLSGVVFSIIFLSGCAGLGDIIQGIGSTDASVEIAAVSSLTDDIVKQPWDNILQVGLGYALALWRRWYKKRRGAK